MTYNSILVKECLFRGGYGVFIEVFIEVVRECWEAVRERLERWFRE